jgi:hypothetical protein
MKKPGSAAITTLPILTIASLMLCISGAVGALAGEQSQIDGVLHVQNGRNPQNGSETVSLEEIWRAGGDSESGSFFGLVTRVLSDRNGNIYLLDPQQQIAHVYTAEGEELDPYFGPGEGPGEVGFVIDLCFTPDDKLAILQMSMRTLVKIGLDGISAGDVKLENRDAQWVMPISAVGRGDYLVVANVEYLAGPKPSAGTRRFVLARYSGDGSEITRYIQRKVEYDHENMVFDEKNQFHGFMWSYAVGPDGRVYALEERNRYAVSVFNPDGTLERVIERDFDSLPRSPRGNRRVRQMAERRYKTAPFKVDYRFESTEPDVAWFHRGLHVDDRGRLWVRHSRSDYNQPEGIMLTLDVFDTGGNFDKQVSFRAPEKGLYNGFFFAGEDRVVVVKGFVDSMRDRFGGGRGKMGNEEQEGESGAVEIICYRIVGADGVSSN